MRRQQPCFINLYDAYSGFFQAQDLGAYGQGDLFADLGPGEVVTDKTPTQNGHRPGEHTLYRFIRQGLATQLAFLEAGAQITAEADGFTPIGTNCKLCPRTDCLQRAFPQVGTTLPVDENQRGFSPYTT